jgi:murein DD-endopeptidase MepM/ murein hydrolase activator NlpD
MPKRKRRLRVLLPIVVFFAIAGTYALYVKPDQPVQQTAIAVERTPPPPPEPTFDVFGIEEGVYETAERTVQRNDTFAGILSEFAVPYDRVLQLVDAAGDIFDVRRIRAGNQLHVYHEEDEARLIVYQQDPIRYVVFDLQGEEPVVEAGERPVEIVERTVGGVITNSLYQSLINGGANPELAVRMSEVYAWAIDFYRIQRNDRFHVVFEERQIDGETVGIERIIAARFNHFGRDYNAFYFEQDGVGDFFDEEGNSLRKAFLRAPLEYTRISSRYNLRRVHPVTGGVRPHLGTDYAAPTGTPIRSVGDGVVTEARFTRGNGNYVKVRHNTTYETQYLHMSRFAQGIRPGTRVKQGQVIGYVGQTGLATGPHLCFRFWKNGRQVDPHAQQMPSADPVAAARRTEFDRLRDALVAQMDSAGDTVFASAGETRTAGYFL